MEPDVTTNPQDGLSTTQRNATQPESSETVSLRRLKKRETDRLSKRRTRERKQLHMQHMEAVMESLEQHDSSGQVAALRGQLERSERERALLVRTLQDIQHLISQRGPRANHSETRSSSTTSDEHGITRAGAIYPPASAAAHRRIQDDMLSSNSNVQDSRKANQEFHPARAIRGGHETNEICAPPPNKTSTKTTIQSQAYNWIKPAAKCSCQTHVNRLSGHDAVWQGNYWKFCVDVLDERFDWAEDIGPADDDESDDVLVRGVLEGWDSVEQNRRAPLHPSLQMLRRVDEAMFGPIPMTERLAMLRAMHLLLQYHTDPTAERYERLPPWYTYRPEQHKKHTYAVEYWAWPQFRLRFVGDEHLYCGNGFFRMYQDEMRLLWPFEFRDCYTHDLETGLYKPSMLFDQRINNINCWTMGPDFFEKFPELSGVIPTNLRSVPQSMPAAGVSRRGKPQSSMNTTFPRQARTGFVEAEDDEPVQRPAQGGNYAACSAPCNTVSLPPYPQITGVTASHFQRMPATTLHQSHRRPVQNPVNVWPNAGYGWHNLSDTEAWFNELGTTGTGSSLDAGIAENVPMEPFLDMD
ncbi:hypothetical protein CB0940_02237 [Cercospora beticola]|uniref:BZIP domain-containing protein n=1 Tax=Cercospora beticola TaxID=122368 RepID=A0A2G5IAF8_CERBT|nr:hypothetical protein CB0940_02237 [Cercospora beticola]PIB01682.1 hypothetical protein CB0940_02237 [Cercospora beticola]WPA97604.1 hypothetical protein RHO25_002214 [Cercospora beticola]